MKPVKQPRHSWAETSDPQFQKCRFCGVVRSTYDFGGPPKAFYTYYSYYSPKDDGFPMETTPGLATRSVISPPCLGRPAKIAHGKKVPLHKQFPTRDTPGPVSPTDPRTWAEMDDFLISRGTSLAEACDLLAGPGKIKASLPTGWERLLADKIEIGDEK